IDRVELAYAEHLIDAGVPLCFAMLTASGRFGRLPTTAAQDYLQSVARAWQGDGAVTPHSRRAKRLARRLRLEAPLHGERALQSTSHRETEKPVYLLVSHHHLERRGAIARLKE